MIYERFSGRVIPTVRRRFRVQRLPMDQGLAPEPEETLLEFTLRIYDDGIERGYDPKQAMDRALVYEKMNVRRFW